MAGGNKEHDAIPPHRAVAVPGIHAYAPEQEPLVHLASLLSVPTRTQENR